MKSFRFYKIVLLNWFSSFAQFSRDTRSVRLTVSEYRATRTAIVEFMKVNPLPSPEPTRASFVSFFARPAFAFASLLLVLGSGWAVADAAESALPGEILYSVKVSVVEPLKERILVSPGAKTQWQVERAKRRLEEAEQLAQQDRLTPQLAQQVKEQFSQQVKVVENSVAVFRQQEGEEAATNVYSQYEATLKVHADVLHQLASVGNENAVRSIATLAATVDDQRSVTTGNRVAAEEKVLAQERPKLDRAADRKKLEAQESVRNLRAQIKESRFARVASADTQVNASVQIAREFLTAGIDQLKQDKPAEAFRSFQVAQRSAHEARTRIDAEEKLGGGIQKQSEFVAVNSTQSISAASSVDSLKSMRRDLRVLVLTNKKEYKSGESVIITVTITNKNDQPMTLEFPTGCQARYSIDGQAVKPEQCTQVISTVTLSPGGAQQWSFTVAGISEGKHDIRGEVTGYGSNAISIRVSEKKEEPSGALPLPREPVPTQGQLFKK